MRRLERHRTLTPPGSAELHLLRRGFSAADCGGPALHTPKSRRVYAKDTLDLHQLVHSRKDASLGTALAHACWDAFSPLADELKARPRKRQYPRESSIASERLTSPADPLSRDDIVSNAAHTSSARPSADGFGRSLTGESQPPVGVIMRARHAPAFSRRSQRNNTQPLPTTQALTRSRVDREQDISTVVRNALLRSHAKGGKSSAFLVPTVKLSYSSDDEEPDGEGRQPAPKPQQQDAERRMAAESEEVQGGECRFKHKHAVTGSSNSRLGPAGDLDASFGRRLSRQRQNNNLLGVPSSALSAPGSRRLSRDRADREALIVWPQPSGGRSCTPSAEEDSVDQSPMPPSRRVQFVL